MSEHETAVAEGVTDAVTPWQQATLQRVASRLADLRAQWHIPRRFPFLVTDAFLPADFAEAILASYPPPDEAGWDQVTYTHQRRKFTRTSDFPQAIDEFFGLTALPSFRALITSITGIDELQADPDLVGGGLHQITAGGFLDVHVDFNFHPKTKLHRRLNLLLYMNKEWRPEYRGALELWDMEEKELISEVLPVFNRCVMFETNEVSYHGHPKPLACPQHRTRKSLAVYYYTKERDQQSTVDEHNTLYRHTTGLEGYVKTSVSSLEATVERLRSEGLQGTVGTIARKVARRLGGLPPENR